MALIVQKYGGSSLATPEHIRRAAGRIEKLKSQGHDLVIVVSAMGRMTDHLIAIAQKTVTSPPKRELDMLLTAGERVSMSLLSMALQSRKVAAISFTGSQSGIITDNEHTQAKIVEMKPLRIQEELKKGKVVIVAGFQGVSVSKEVTTLGRGGSDTTAVAIAAALKADECQILTDVDGLFTADPRIVPNAQLLDELDLNTALEFARLGAKMQSRSIGLAKEYGVTVRISNSQKENRGTLLTPKKQYDGASSMETQLVQGIATHGGFSFFKIKASIYRLGFAFEENIVPQLLKCDEIESCFIIPEEFENELIEKLTENKIAYEKKDNIAQVSAVGNIVGFFSEILKVIQTVEKPILLIAKNSFSFSIAVNEADKEAFARALHVAFIEEKATSREVAFSQTEVRS